MRNIVPVLLLSILAVGCTKAPEYSLVWSDEFNGDAIDTAIWNLDDNARGGGNAELQYYAPKNVAVGQHPETGDGCMIISAQREDYYYADGGYRPCTSGRVNTQDKFTIQYGKIEARICFPHTANGLWPAFWMLGNDLMTNLGNDDSCDKQHEEGRVGWPKCGEIDICEMGHSNGILNGTQDSYFNGAAHWGESWNNGAYPNKGGFLTAPYPLQGEFHTWTLIWEPDTMAMYLDSIAEPYFALSLRGKEVNEPGYYFNKPFYLLFNLSIGGFFPDMPNPEKYSLTISPDLLEPVTALPSDGTPVKMYVDYVRVYQKK